MSPITTRRRMLGASAGALAAAWLTPRVAHARDRKPNLLYILADDHAGYVLGAQGNRRASTPNLDRLAAEGTRFSRNYCNSPARMAASCNSAQRLPVASRFSPRCTPDSAETVCTASPAF